MIANSKPEKSAPEEWRPAPAPATQNLAKLRAAAAACTACPLYKNATQTVFGEGPRDAALVFVGEQPGDREDREGRPFIGPAGQLLACRPWLAAELAAIQPRVLVCLGGTAAKSVLGPAARLLRDRGRVLQSPFCERTVVTVHPSSLLRAPDEAARGELRAVCGRPAEGRGVLRKA